MDQAPVWDDLTTFDGRPWRGVVDLVSAGFPCQPWSAAGQRGGTDDARWLWPDIARLVAETRARFVFVENVPGLASGGGLGEVLGGLADLGFDAEWLGLAAADVGASHRRERLFVLGWQVADSDVDGLEGIGREPPDDRDARDDADRPGGQGVANPGGARRQRPEHASQPRVGSGHRCDSQVADAESVGLLRGRQAQRHEDDAGHRPQPGRNRDLWPPVPLDRDGWERAIGAGMPQPSVRRVAHGLAHRLDRLHVIGNGVVPLVAAVAFRRLVRRAGLVTGP